MTITAEARRAICRKAGQARARQFTPEYQRKARAAQTRECCAIKGRKGFEALVRKYGQAHALEHLAKYRREHPNAVERLVIAWLNERGIAYQQEAQVCGYYVDFLVGQANGSQTVVEVDGRGWHSNIALHGQDRRGRDTLRDMALAANGYTVIRLAEADIRSGAAFEQLQPLASDKERLT